MLPLALCLAVLAPGPWRTYEVYRPTITREFVVNPHAQALKYNHDSAVAWFGDRWFCLWNANEPAAEGKPGQLNYQATSDDGRVWSPPVACFADPAHSVDPVPCPSGTQWQPNLIVVDDALWAVWSQNSRDEYNGCYVSVLREPNGRWENRRLLWDGHHEPEVDGQRWRLFPTQNPIRLRSGRILAPITMSGADAADAPDGVTGWWAREKRNSVLYSDDAGATWQVSPGAVQPGRSWAQWEPTVFEQADGSVMMLARNNDFRGRQQDGPRPAEMLLWSISTDGGATWTPHRYVPLQTVASRMHVMPLGGDRFVMVHNDWPADAFVADRRNLALFFTRGGSAAEPAFDFVAGPGVSGHEAVVAYPQMWVHDGEMLISYSQGNAYRGIKVARLSPLPAADRHYLFPRDNLPAPPAPTLANGAYQFSGDQWIAGRQPVDPGAERFSVGMVVRGEDSGTLIDTRGDDGGIVMGLMGAHQLVPFLHLGTPEGNLASPLALPSGQWAYVGVSVDNVAGKATFFVGDQQAEVPFTAPAARPFAGVNAHLGYKRMQESRLTGLRGELQSLAVVAHSTLDAAGHDALAAALVEGRRPDGSLALHFDARDAEAVAREFELPEGGWHRIETLDGGARLRLHGEASAGVDLDANHRAAGDAVELTFRFRLLSGDGQVLATLGDANQPARLVHQGGHLWLLAGDARAEVGAVAAGEWTPVSLTTAGDRTTAALGDGPPATVTHRPEATWLYLGQGYREDAVPADAGFEVDVGSVRSRVVAP